MLNNNVVRTTSSPRNAVVRPRAAAAAEPARRSGVDLLSDWLCAYGEYRVVAPMGEPTFRAVLRAPTPVPGRPVFAELMRATGQSAEGGSPAEVV